MPLPAFALLLIAVIAFAAWSLLTRTVAPGRPETDNRAESAPGPQGAPAPGREATDLSRYDRGGRAVIYKTRRPQPDTVRQ
jgi:hypothetical protein